MGGNNDVTAGDSRMGDVRIHGHVARRSRGGLALGELKMGLQRVVAEVARIEFGSPK